MMLKASHSVRSSVFKGVCLGAALLMMSSMMTGCLKVVQWEASGNYVQQSDAFAGPLKPAHVSWSIDTKESTIDSLGFEYDIGATGTYQRIELPLSATEYTWTPPAVDSPVVRSRVVAHMARGETVTIGFNNIALDATGPTAPSIASGFSSKVTRSSSASIQLHADDLGIAPSGVDHYTFEQYWGEGCTGSVVASGVSSGASTLALKSGKNSLKIVAYDRVGNASAATCSTSVQYNRAQLFKDINLTALPDVNGNGNQFFGEAGGRVYFAAATDDTGVELWSYDPVTGKPALVKDIEPGVGSSFPSYFTAVGSTLYFIASTSAQGAELWRSDGTESGTYIVKDLTAGPGGTFASVTAMLPFGTGVAIAASAQIYVSDGTAAGTFKVTTATNNYSRMGVLGSKIFFEGNAGGTGYQLWASDGTVAGTALFKSGNTPQMSFSKVGSSLYFNGTSAGGVSGIYLTDGTVGGTVLVKSATTAHDDYVAFGVGQAIFSGQGGDFDYEPWVTDGSAANTVRLKNINAATSSSPSGFVAVGTKVMFLADDGSGVQLWTSDGTGAGTAKITTGPDLSVSAPVAAPGGNVAYFAGRSTASGSELWRTDGTDAGTSLFADLNPGAAGSNPGNLFIASNGKLYFTATGPSGVTEPWVSDGTVSGTNPISASYSMRTDSSGASGFTPFAGSLFFAAKDELGTHLYKTDGDPSHVYRIPGVPDKVAVSAGLTVFNGELYFSGVVNGVSNDPNYGLWKVDSTGTTATLVKAIGADLTLKVIAGHLFFTTNSAQAWASDGTTAGTVKLVNVGATGVYPLGSSAMILAGSTMYLSDGTVAGTTLVGNLPCTVLTPAVSLGNLAVFFAMNTAGPATGFEPWVTDGTLAGTHILVDINPGAGNSYNWASPVVLGGVAYFAATDPTHGAELWRSDGTTAGTYLVRDVVSGAGSLFPFASPIQVINGALYFRGSDQATGTRIWTSDGTAAGTKFVADLAPGVAPLTMSFLGMWNGSLYLSVTQASTGAELWQLNPATGENFMVQDINPGSNSALAGAYNSFTPFNGKLFFTAGHDVFGYEGWVLDP